MTPITLHCSFCRKAASEVERLVGGPGVTICNECVTLCQQILADTPDHGNGAPLFSVGYPPSDAAELQRDRRLVIAHLHGDGDAFYVIIDEYSTVLLEEAQRLLGPTPEADKAVHETFLRAVQTIRLFDQFGQWQLRPWLIAILRHMFAERNGETASDS